MMLRNSVAVLSGILLSALSLLAAPPPFQRSQWTTNPPNTQLPGLLLTNLYASNLVNGGQAPFGTVETNLTTNAYAVMVMNPDGTRRTDPTVIVSNQMVGINTLPSTELTVMGQIHSRTNIATNGMFYVANGLLTPLHAFGSLMLHKTDGSSILNLAPQNTFFTITNYNAITTNLFVGSTAEGMLTNLVAGYYKVILSGTADSAGAANHFHFHAFTNGVECDVIGSEADNITGTVQTASAAAAGILYFAANTQFSLRVANKASTGFITNVHATLTISSP